MYKRQRQMQGYSLVVIAGGLQTGSPSTPPATSSLHLRCPGSRILLPSYLCCCLATKQVAHQASLSMEFSRQEYWSGLPFPIPGNLHDPGIEPASPALTGRFLPMCQVGSPKPRCKAAQTGAVWRGLRKQVRTRETTKYSKSPLCRHRSRNT